MFCRARAMKLTVAGVLLAMAAMADGERNHYLARFLQKSGEPALRFWLNGVEVPKATVIADKGCDVTVVDMKTDNPTIQDNYEFHSWTFDNTNAISELTGPWLDQNSTFTIGEGGVTLAANNRLSFGNKFTDTVRVKLAESQTWSGPATGTTWAQFTMGWKQFYGGGHYWRSTFKSLKDIVWTLDGRIKVSLTASNDLSNVDLVVNPNARLILIGQFFNSSNIACNAHLNAKSLTLKGGDAGSSLATFTVGAQNPDTVFGTTSAPSTFDDATVSPKVNLVDGASIKGGTFDYAVSELNVSGGDSTISGAVTLKKKVGIDIAANASLAFTGSVSADEGAGVELTGDGSLVITNALFGVPIGGNGNIRCDPGAGVEVVISGDLSSFTGSIHVATGTLLIHSDAQLNPAATVTAAEGASYRYITAADFGDYTENGKWYYRDSDGVRHQYQFLNGFESNTHFPGSVTFREIPDVVASDKWRSGSVFVVDQKFGGGIGIDASLAMEGFIATEDATVPSSTYAYFDQDYDFTVGERGIDIRQLCSFYIWMPKARFRLSKSQTWRGPAAATLSASPARLHVGGSPVYYYPTGSITPLMDGLELTIEGDLDVLLYYPTNNMTTADVTVKAPARLTLANPSGKALPMRDWSGRLNARQLTFDGGSGGLAMPKSDLISPEMLAPRIVLKNGATFSLTGKSWTGVTLVASGASTVNSLTGTHTLLDDVMNLEAEVGATLDISAATFKRGEGVAGGFSATGAGTIRLSVDQLVGGFAVDGPSIVLTGRGAWTNALAAASGLTIDTSTYVFVTSEALAGYGATEINVTSGTLFLDSVASLPQGCKVVTSGTGALALYDMTGFDADVHMGGTKNVVSDDLFVTDAARENEALTVPAGQFLHIAGSGLKSSSTVTLEDGASIIFHKTATIYAPVTLTGAATIRTIDASAEGTFAGAVTAGDVASQTGNCDIWAPGGIVFAGGAAIHKTPVCQRSGTVIIRDKEFSLQKSAGGFYMFEGYCLITNCTAESIANGGEWYLNRANQTGDVALEVAAGATFKHGNNTRIFIGASTNFESRLIVNGGTFTHETYDRMYINENGNGKGVFELRAGEFRTQRRVITGFKPGTSVGCAKFIWSGGTWSTTSTGSKYKYTHLFESTYANSGLEFIVSGTDCVLDLTYFQYADSISNFNNGVSTMVGMPGARLRVKGKQNVLSKLTLANFTPNGMALDLNPEPSCDVEIPCDGSDLELGWVVPGTGGVVRCIGTASPLLANYVVPSGETFENAHVNDSWNAGFASVTANDLVFGDGATYLLRTTAQGLPAIDFAGALVTSGNVKYAVDASGGAIPESDGTVIVRTGEGFSGDGTWSAASARLGRMSSVTAEGNNLLFSYRLKGVVISIR